MENKITMLIINTKELASARKFLMKLFTVDGINTKWNLSGLSNRKATVKTTTRWMCKGPNTKNPKFEPFLIELAKSHGWSKQSNAAIIITHTAKLKWLVDNDKVITSINDKAAIAGVSAYFNVQPTLSRKQTSLIDNIYGRYSS